ncbi:ROK family glucokinase [Ornithinimicrobium flavum]|uniref:ROK family glucokinase n=1 Tax=Ornithinimicrobium flavum TaxID=1288636 RepID=UPI0010703DB6|nr:ROK family glucokinase [Ornithinimicrobium flavum]
MSGPFAIGVDVGGTRLKAGLVDDRGAVLVETVRDTPARTSTPEVLEDAVVGVVVELLGRAEGPVAAVGIGAAGFVDAERGVVVFAPHLPWRDHPLRDRLAERLDVPVLVDNDANAAGWAEHRFGAGQGETHLAVVTLGTGIGGAVITHGRLQRGRRGLAGEFGHQQMVPGGRPCECGHDGCWEQYVSGSVVGRAGQELVRAGGAPARALDELCGGDPARLTGEHVTRAARAGDPASVAVLAEVGERLGEGLAGVVAALDPGRVVVGGGLSEAGELLLRPARTALSRRLVGGAHRSVPDVVAARLGARAGLVGAADLARGTAGGGGG